MEGMDTTVRLFHVLFGIIVGGVYVFLVPILQPELRKLGPAVQGPVMQALMPILVPTMAVSFVGLVITGLIIMAQARGLGSLFDSGWGVDMLIGLIATVVVMVIGFGIVVPSGIKIGKARGGDCGRRARANPQGKSATGATGRQEREADQDQLCLHSPRRCDNADCPLFVARDLLPPRLVAATQ